jgi:hypothetical protein
LELPFPSGGVVEEQVPILARGLRGDWLSPGESKTLPFLPSALRARLEHHRQEWGQATFSRAAKNAEVVSALGRIESYAITVEEKGGPSTTWTIEATLPHRILGWKSSTGEAGKLRGSTRLAYWKLHDNGQESYLKQLGLTPPR